MRCAGLYSVLEYLVPRISFFSSYKYDVISVVRVLSAVFLLFLDQASSRCEVCLRRGFQPSPLGPLFSRRVLVVPDRARRLRVSGGFYCPLVLTFTPKYHDVSSIIGCFDGLVLVVSIIKGCSYRQP